MQWSGDRNAGFSRAASQRLFLPVIIDPEFHFEAVNVETYQNNPNSFLWWMKRLIALRKRFQAFGRGSLEVLYPENRKVLAFIRRYEEERVLVVANLSRFSQYVELDLSAFTGMTPVEVFGGTRFPAIGALSYLLTLAPHGFFWFSLEPAEASLRAPAEPKPGEIPQLKVAGTWERLFSWEQRPAFEEILPDYLLRRRWFAGKARGIKGVSVHDVVALGGGTSAAAVLIRVGYKEGEDELYFLPLSFSREEKAREVLENHPQEVLARLSTAGGEGVLYGAMVDETFCSLLFESILRRRRFRGSGGELAGVPARALRAVKVEEKSARPSLVGVEQSNTSIRFGDWMMLKMIRRLEPGRNPELEIGLALTETVRFAHVPPVAGHLEYRSFQEGPMHVGILHWFVPNQGDAWRYTLDSLGGFYEQAAARLMEQREPPAIAGGLFDAVDGGVAEADQEHVGLYLESARLLGLRTGELHLALASIRSDPEFAPEPFSPFYQRSLYQSMRNQAAAAWQLLRGRRQYLNEAAAGEARLVLESESRVMESFHALIGPRCTALRTRIHGDFHLGQVLHTGRDFVFIDFEGEPAHSLTTRRLKRSPLRDVAGMLRSFDYAAHAALFEAMQAGVVREKDLGLFEGWARFWVHWVSAEFLRSYLRAAAPGGFLPQEREELRLLLNAFLLEKAAYELAYELNNRPDWVRLPLRGILRILEESA